MTGFSKSDLSPGHTVLRRRYMKGHRRFFEEVLEFFSIAKVLADWDNLTPTAELKKCHYMFVAVFNLVFIEVTLRDPCQKLFPF